MQTPPNRFRRYELLMQRLIHEPLAHFFVLGTILFAIFGWVNSGTQYSPGEVIIDTNRIESLRWQFERVRKRPPTEEELSSLIDSWAREEILYREGQALGIDQQDPVIRRRVAQKMSYLAEALVDTSLTDEELQAGLDDNADKYKLDARYRFRQTYIDPTRHADDLESVIASIRVALPDAHEQPPGDSTSLPSSMDNATATNIARTFGSDFAESLADVPTGEWSGPIRSTYGLHFIFIDESTPERMATLDEARAAVERDLIAQRTLTASDTLYEALKSRYTIRYSDEVQIASDNPSGASQ